MAEESKSPERFSLSRWSRRKLDAARTAPPAPGDAPAPHAVPTSTAPSSDATAVAPVPRRTRYLPRVTCRRWTR